ncbi:MAG: RNA 2',3'-cyclic phosphodiesterase, partial [Chloroflexota bacterium]
MRPQRPPSPTIRAFVAIELPGAVRRALSQAQEGLKPASGNAMRWVNTEGIHLTLKFLGDIEEARVPEIISALEAACAPVPPFNLGLGQTGAFPNPGSPRVLWVGLTGSLDSLVYLQRRVEDGLEALGFPHEERGFSPHLTLGRVREGIAPGQRRDIGQALARCQVPVVAPFRVDGLALMRSQLTPQGAI